MADEITPRFNLVKPEVGGSADTWGDKWNENADKIDAAIIKPDEENVWSAPQHFDGGLYAGAANPTDTTPGRVLKVGDFGVGNTISIPQGADLNDYTIPGEYFQPTNANAIPELNYPDQLAGFLKVAQTTGDGFVQEYTTHGDTIRKFLRGFYNGTWSSWVELYNTGNTDQPIGVDQTWQDVTDSRMRDTTYTNTTKRSIAVAISLNNVSRGFLRVDGVDVSLAYNAYQPFQMFTIVPPGSSYRLGITGNIELWAELR